MSADPVWRQRIDCSSGTRRCRRVEAPLPPIPTHDFIVRDRDRNRDRDLDAASDPDSDRRASDLWKRTKRSAPDGRRFVDQTSQGCDPPSREWTPGQTFQQRRKIPGAGWPTLRRYALIMTRRGSRPTGPGRSRENPHAASDETDGKTAEENPWSDNFKHQRTSGGVAYESGEGRVKKGT